MGFWRSLRDWWSWDGSPDTDPFGRPAADGDTEISSDVSGHAHAAVDLEPAEEETEA